MIRHAKLSDAESIVSIYNYYVLNSIITFEEEIVSSEEMRSRIENIIKSHTWLVFEENDMILGYAYSYIWKPRTAYRYTNEISVYISNDFRGKGIGTALYKNLIGILKEKGIHNIIAGIALPNNASVAIHESFGFKKVGVFKESGKKFGAWVDVGYWELLLPLENTISS